MYLYNKPCMTQGILNDLNLNEINYYPFMINLDKCDGSWNIADTLYTKICALSETKDIILRRLMCQKE